MKRKTFFIIVLCIFLTGLMYGCVEEEEKENEAPSCTLAVNPNSGIAPLTVTFTLTASDSDGSISSWELDINNDGVVEYSGTGNPPKTLVHTYNNSGAYSAEITVTDNQGSTDTDTVILTVRLSLVMTFKELADDYKVEKNDDAKEVTQQFQSFNEGDTVIIKDTINNISYNESDDFTKIESSSYIGGTFSIAGDITDNFSTGDAIKIEMTIISVFFTEQNPYTDEIWTYNMEVLKEGWDTENHKYIPVPQKYIQHVNPTDMEVIMTFNEFVHDLNYDYNNDTKTMTYWFQSLNDGDTIIIRDTIHNITVNESGEFSNIEFTSSLGNNFSIAGDITDDFNTGDTVEVKMHIISVQFTERSTHTNEDWTIKMEIMKEGWDTENHKYIPVPQKYIAKIE